MTRERTYTWEDPMEIVRGGAGLSGAELFAKLKAGELPPPPITKTLGMELVEVGEGRAEFSLEPQEFHYNPIGVVHGGIAATLLDSVMGCAVHTTLEAGVAYTTLELKVNYVGPILSDTGRITAIGDVIHRGGRIATAEGRVTRADGKLLAHATTTCAVMAAPG
jgi:uncharacterized protein (TIGR00369 family)